jgi:hypothetical protein
LPVFATDRDARSDPGFGRTAVRPYQLLIDRLKLQGLNLNPNVSGP